jgi:predicted aspartyl protease
MVAHQFSGRILNGCRRTTPSLAQFTNPAAYNGSEVKINAYMRESILVSVGLLVCLSPLCGAQQSASPVTISTQVALGLVYMQGQVNDSGPLNVILDSGASASIVSPQVAEAAGLTSARSAEAAGIGKGSSQTLRLIDSCEFKWGASKKQLSLTHQGAAILPIDYISAQVGKRVDAIFGSNVFVSFSITVDYEHETATFFPPGAELHPSGTPIPIQVSGKVPFVTATVEGENGKTVSGLFLVDSGTAGQLILNRKFLEAHPGLLATGSFVDAPAVSAVGGEIRFKIVRVPRIGVGPHLFSGVVAAVPESSSGVLENAAIAGFIGAGLLSRFTVTWDYANQRMYLLPNDSLERPFETDASGAHLTAKAPDYRTISIDSVLPGSPAAKAGLTPGDEIRSVNGVTGLPLWKVVEAFRKAGTAVELAVERTPDTLKVTLPLRSPFQRSASTETLTKEAGKPGI